MTRGPLSPMLSTRDADPLAILDRRLAEGQISVEEYELRRKTLASSVR